MTRDIPCLCRETTHPQLHDVMSRDIRKTRTLIRVRVSCFSVLRAWLGDDESGATDDAVDGRSGDGDLAVVLKVPDDRVCAGVTNHSRFAFGSIATLGPAGGQ